MNNTSPEVDRYIDDAPPFARDIIERLRRAAHAADESVTESLRWGHPSFDYGGKILVHAAAFQQHVSWSIRNGKRIRAVDVDALGSEAELTERFRDAIVNRTKS